MSKNWNPADILAVPPFPAGAGLSVVTMNWACLIFGFVVIWSILYYLVKGRHVYEGPVAYVRKLE